MPEELSESQHRELVEQLEHAVVELERLLAQTRDSARPVELDQEAIGRVSRIDAIQQQKMAVAQRGRHTLRLQQVRAALARHEEGEYGLCVRCEEDIGYKRLKVVPESALCMACLTQIERR